MRHRARRRRRRAIAQHARAQCCCRCPDRRAPLGQAMLNAGYMALFDEAPMAWRSPRDTGGTPQGAPAAARAAIADGARVLIGPLTSAEAARSCAARAAGVPVLPHN
jgi:hypothetical protein